MNIMILVILLILFYSIGSLPIGYIIGRLKGVNVKKKGSGNIGGTNVGRLLGLKYGVTVVLLDVLKGLIPLLIIKQFYSNEIVLLLGIALIAGHIFSLFLHFKGGKGVGTMVGVAFALLPLSYLIPFTIFWLIIVLTTRYMSLSNLIVVLGFPLYYFVFYQNQTLFYLSYIIVALLYFSHRENIKRLLSGTENKLSKRK